MNVWLVCLCMYVCVSVVQGVCGMVYLKGMCVLCMCVCEIYIVYISMYCVVHVYGMVCVVSVCVYMCVFGIKVCTLQC